MTKPPAMTSSPPPAEPGSVLLTAATFPTPVEPNQDDPNVVAASWLTKFNETLSSGSYARLDDLFLEESYWRDHLCLSWDYHTFDGPHNAAAFLGANGCRIKRIELDTSSALRSPGNQQFDVKGEVHGVQAFLKISTTLGTGEGVVKLVRHDGWRAFTLYTCLATLKDHEERIGGLRPLGVESGVAKDRKTWHEKRAAQENMADVDPPVIIVGELNGF